jgi:hypothetical protein
MNHLSHEELIDHSYGEGAPETAEHLATCAVCAKAHRALEADLNEFPSPAASEPDSAPIERLWSALSPRLVPYTPQHRSWLRPAYWLSLGAAGAAAVLILAAFFAGRFWEHRYQPRTNATVTNVPAQQKIVVVVLSDQLDRSERLLVQLKHANADDTQMLAPMRDEARSILAADRKCREEAKESGDPDVTKALDHLDQLLSQMANQPGGLNAASISKLQEEMNAEGLLFEVRVLRSRIPEPQHAKGGTA